MQMSRFWVELSLNLAFLEELKCLRQCGFSFFFFFLFFFFNRDCSRCKQILRNYLPTNKKWFGFVRTAQCYLTEC